jgi:hypothetical protein
MKRRRKSNVKINRLCEIINLYPPLQYGVDTRIVRHTNQVAVTVGNEPYGIVRQRHYNAGRHLR